MGRAPLPHDDAAILEKDLRVDRVQGISDRCSWSASVEDVVGVAFHHLGHGLAPKGLGAWLHAHTRLTTADEHLHELSGNDAWSAVPTRLEACVTRDIKEQER